MSWRSHRRARPSRAGSCHSPWGWKDRSQGGSLTPRNQLGEAGTRERLQVSGSRSHREGLFSFPPHPPIPQHSSHKTGAGGSQRAGKWGQTALLGVSEQSWGRAAPGAESQQLSLSETPPLRPLTLLPPHPGDQQLKSL